MSLSMEYLIVNQMQMALTSQFFLRRLYPTVYSPMWRFTGPEEILLPNTTNIIRRLRFKNSHLFYVVF
jgi:hypothetical protein